MGGSVDKGSHGAGRATGLQEPGPASPPPTPTRGPHITDESPAGPESSSWGNNRLPLQSALPLKQGLVVLQRPWGSCKLRLLAPGSLSIRDCHGLPPSAPSSKARVFPGGPQLSWKCPSEMAQVPALLGPGGLHRQSSTSDQRITEAPEAGSTPAVTPKPPQKVIPLRKPRLPTSLALGLRLGLTVSPTGRSQVQILANELSTHTHKPPPSGLCTCRSLCLDHPPVFLPLRLITAQFPLPPHKDKKIRHAYLKGMYRFYARGLFCKKIPNLSKEILIHI